MSQQTDSNDALPIYAQEEKIDRRNRRVALAVAVAFHIALLAIQLPSRSAEAVEPDKQDVIMVLQQVQFKPPPPPSEPITKPRERRLPMPDPTPDDPEPIRLEEEIPQQLDIPTDEIDINFPSEPPPVTENVVARAGADVSKPVRTHYVAPQYTEIARRARIEGLVIIDATIDTDGNVVDARILRPLSFGLDQSALDAVKQWKFEPSALNGRPVSVLYTVTVTFELQ